SPPGRARVVPRLDLARAPRARARLPHVLRQLVIRAGRLPQAARGAHAADPAQARPRRARRRGSAGEPPRRARGRDPADLRADAAADALLSARPQRSCTCGRTRSPYSSRTPARNASGSGATSAAAAFARACGSVRAPGITVVTPGCWITHASAA